MTDAERALWRQLRAKIFENLKFRRQVPIGSYVADFCSLRDMLIIEVDGGQHDLNRGSDAIRTRFLEQEGFTVLPFWNHEVLRNIDGVMFEIGQATGLEETN